MSDLKNVVSCNVSCRLLSLNAFLILAMAGLVTADDQYRQFRGPQGNGVAASTGVVFDTDTDEHLMWRTETPETGWSSPITDGKRLWMTAAKTTEATQQQKDVKLKDAKFAGMKQIMASVDLFAICLDAATGEMIHKITLDHIESPDSINTMNSFASPTGVWAGDRVVHHFGRYGTFCLDANTGELLWKRAIPFEDSMGPGSSIVESSGVIIVPCDGTDVQFVVGLSLENGNELWRTERPEMSATDGEFRKSYSTPLLVEIEGQPQAVIPAAEWCVAYHPQTGKEIWRFRHGKGFSVSAAPVYADGKVLFSSGYGGKEVIAIDPTGSGDVTDSHELWRCKRVGPVMPSLAVIPPYVYSLAEGGILAAINLADGALEWRQRIGSQYSASPLVSGNRLLIGDHDGNVTILRSADKYTELARYELGEQIMASPVPIGDDLVLRTKHAVYRFSK